MSNTKQQITKMLEDYHQPYCNAITYRLGCICGLRENIQAIDRLVTEARLEEHKELLDWYTEAKIQPHIGSMVDKIQDRIAELQSQLTNKESK